MGRKVLRKGSKKGSKRRWIWSCGKVKKVNQKKEVKERKEDVQNPKLILKRDYSKNHICNPSSKKTKDLLLVDRIFYQEMLIIIFILYTN